MRKPSAKTKQKTQDSAKVLSEKLQKSLKQTGLFMTVLPLSACIGGKKKSPPTEDPAPAPPAPTPDFTENPTNVFVASDDAGRTLSQAGSTANLTVTGGAGDDIITTGSGADTVNALDGADNISTADGNDIIRGGGGNDTIGAGAGNDIIRGGEGADSITAGTDDDAIVLVGTTTAGQYDQTDITDPAGSGFDLSSVISLADLNGRTVSEVTAGEVINGGAGTNTLYIYGTVDLTGVTLSNVTVLVVNSDVTLTPEQIAQFTTVNGDGTSVINIEIPPGSTDNYILDLSVVDTANVAEINIIGDITVEINDASDLSGIGSIAARPGDTLNVEVAGNGGATTVNLGDIADVIDSAEAIEVATDVTLEIDDAADITNLGLEEINGTGDIDTGSNSAVENELSDSVSIDENVNASPVLTSNTASTDEENTVTIDVLANDSDPDGHTLTISTAGIANGGGTVSIVNNEIVYDPNGNYDYLNTGQSDVIRIDYTVTDALGADASSFIDVTVNGVANIFNGTNANDIIIGTSGDDLIKASIGTDIIDGGDGIDEIDYSAYASTITVDLEAGTATFFASPNSQLSNIEVLRGGSGNDNFTAAATGSILYGEAGDDFLYGGSGNDTLSGGADNDTITPGGGADIIDGGNWDDLIIFDENSSITNDTIDGGDGGDTIELRGTIGNLNLNDLNAVSIEYIRSYTDNAVTIDVSAHNVLTIGSVNELMLIGSANDTVNTSSIWTYSHDEEFTEGWMHIFTSGTATIQIDTDFGSINGFAPITGGFYQHMGGTNYYVSKNDMDGTFDMSGSIVDFTVESRDGSDTITTGTGNDHVHTGGGADVVSTGVGNDLVDLIEGTDFNLVDIDTGADEDTVFLQSPNVGLDLSQISLSNVEILSVASENGQPTSLTLTAQDVLDVTDDDDILMIYGGADSQVSSTGQGWVQGANDVVHGRTFETYTSGDATLYVETVIDLDIS